MFRMSQYMLNSYCCIYYYNCKSIYLIFYDIYYLFKLNNKSIIVLREIVFFMIFIFFILKIIFKKNKEFRIHLNLKNSVIIIRDNLNNAFLVVSCSSQ